MHVISNVFSYFTLSILLQGVVFDLPNKFNEIVKVICVTNLVCLVSVHGVC